MSGWIPTLLQGYFQRLSRLWSQTLNRCRIILGHRTALLWPAREVWPKKHWPILLGNISITSCHFGIHLFVHDLFCVFKLVMFWWLWHTSHYLLIFFCPCCIALLEHSQRNISYIWTKKRWTKTPWTKLFFIILLDNFNNVCICSDSWSWVYE